MFKFIFSEYKGFALGMQSLRLDAKTKNKKMLPNSILKQKNLNQFL